MFEDVLMRWAGRARVNAAASPAPLSGPGRPIVDLVFERSAWIAVAEFGRLAARSLIGGCPMPGVGSVAFANTLDHAAPCPALAQVLDSLEPGSLHDAALIEAIAGWDRVTSWATARQGELLRELAARRRISRTEEFTSDEIASRLGCTRNLAENRLGLAEALGNLPSVADALSRGDIDPRKADALATTLAHLPIETVAAICDTVLPDAPTLTVPALKARLRKLELTIDPEAAADRATRARHDRHVRLTPTTDAMAWLTALLPAEDAMKIYTAIDAIASTTASPEDPRNVDQRRADALTDIAAAVLNTGIAPSPNALIPKYLVPSTGCAGDGNRENTVSREDAVSREDMVSREETTGGQPLSSQHRRRPHLQVTIAATTLLGLDNHPCELAGYGPVPADVGRRIATDSTWRALYTDPVTGELTGIGARIYPPTDCYRPGAGLTRTIIARDETCTFPGCRQPSWRCDLDHITPADPDRPVPGQTAYEGLHCLCRHHHRLKTHGGWTVIRDSESGHTSWTSPTGHTYLRPATTAGNLTLTGGTTLTSGTELTGSGTPGPAGPPRTQRRPSTLMSPPDPPLVREIPRRPSDDEPPPF